MELKYRDGTSRQVSGSQQRVLSFLYGTAFGRLLLRPLVCRWPSRLVGWFMSRKVSCLLIEPFIRSNDIDMSQFEQTSYKSYNDFFTRKIKSGARVMDMAPDHLISPCDSKLTVLPVTEDGTFTIKHTSYTMSSLLQDEALARRYCGGWLLIFRLSVEDYHRYCYPMDGTVFGQKHIPGRFHTVMPISNDYYPVYKENTREYCVLDTEYFGEAIMMEVGALMVGKIVNYPVEGPVKRGQEKGKFQFGGSTIVMALKKDCVTIDEDLLSNSAGGYETVVKYGEKIGQSKV
ncbi:MAG: phosphatidylserine decarboxylase [Oscillospiraceae bacterium]|nr:phosphatidylserine decarboxylase [Oscillospiraceae bacterium]